MDFIGTSIAVIVLATLALAGIVGLEWMALKFTVWLLSDYQTQCIAMDSITSCRIIGK